MLDWADALYYYTGAHTAVLLREQTSTHQNKDTTIFIPPVSDSALRNHPAAGQNISLKECHDIR